MDDPRNSRDHRTDPFHLRSSGTISKLTNQQLARRKNAQADLSIVGSTLGLGALAAKGGGAAATKWLKPASKLRQVAVKTEKQTNNALIVGAGVGGVAGFNSASISRAEAKKAKRNANKTKLVKSAFGVEH